MELDNDWLPNIKWRQVESKCEHPENHTTNATAIIIYKYSSSSSSRSSSGVGTGSGSSGSSGRSRRSNSLSQWLNFKLSGITCLVGKISRLNFLSQGFMDG